MFEKKLIDTKIIYQPAVECEQADVLATPVNKVLFFMYH
ncbi:hypothetical protein T4A_7196 [Trichinella pseudospiralis]|uniref:Uncharacterized protein n=1 Tax=Trichinella pseudospiralis TaxID=6337 RepID=A0A0V1AMP0_TRIPS|nr:hypothetical protein T4A_7196 [Trichinella pseudospiralis]